MPDITLPAPGVTAGPAWASQLNGAVTAINTATDENTEAVEELSDLTTDGRLSEEGISTEIAAGIIEMGAGPNTGIVFYYRADGCLVMVGEEVSPPPLPDAPTSVIATPGIAQVALSWTAPAPAFITDYVVQYRTVGSGTWLTATRTPSTDTTQTITGLSNGLAYEAHVAAVNSTGVGAYSTATTFTPGLVNGTVFSDSGSRTAADLSGSMPTFGPSAWVGTTGQFSVDGSYIAGKSGAAGSLQRVNVGARGLFKLTGVINVDTLATSPAVSTRIYIKYAGSGSTDVAYLTIGVSTAGAASFTFTAIANSVGISNTFGMPASAIPATTAAADYAFTIDQTSATTYVVTINGTTRTVTLASDPGATHAQATQIGLTTNSPRVKYKNLVLAVNGSYV